MTLTDQYLVQQAKDYSLPFIRGRSLMILALLCVAQFINVLQFQSVTLVLPAVQHGLGFSSELLQWVVNTNVLAFGGGLLVAGRLADLFGHRRLFLFGLMLSAPGSLLSGFAISPFMLIIGRIIQGTSSAMMIPAALALLIDMFPKEAQRY
jgi:MFS family permease